MTVNLLAPTRSTLQRLGEREPAVLQLHDGIESTGRRVRFGGSKAGEEFEEGIRVERRTGARDLGRELAISRQTIVDERRALDRARHRSRSLQSMYPSRSGVISMCVLLLATLAVVVPRSARAQEIEPNDLVPLPPGSNVIEGYYAYGDLTEFNVANGPTFADKTGMQVNLGAGRYLHYFTLGGHPAAVQILQTFGSESGGEINGASLGSTFGAADIALNAALWPYADRARGRYLVVVGWLYPPSGSYDPRSALNLGENRWKGNLQIGWHQTTGRRFSYDLAFDTTIYGENGDAYPGGLKLTQVPTYRVQAWANWRWAPGIETSLGYEGLFGGKQSLGGVANGQKTEEQRVRAAASYFITPTLQVLLEINHDLQVVGGFRQEFGAVFRIAMVF
ncbi:MAG: transporter [Rhodospirillales bacterium]|nr:transporter [Rhodospirillales bacterium]